MSSGRGGPTAFDPSSNPRPDHREQRGRDRSLDSVRRSRRARARDRRRRSPRDRRSSGRSSSSGWRSSACRRSSACWRGSGGRRLGERGAGQTEEWSRGSRGVAARALERCVGLFEIARSAEPPVTPLGLGALEREHGTGRARFLVPQALDDHCASCEARLRDQCFVSGLRFGADAQFSEVTLTDVLGDERSRRERRPGHRGREPRRRRRRWRRRRTRWRGRSRRTRRAASRAHKGQQRAKSPDPLRAEASSQMGAQCEAQTRMVTRLRCATPFRRGALQ